MARRIVRSVTIDEWRLSEALNHRRERLLDVPTPHDLVDQLLAVGASASDDGLTRLSWKESDDRPGYFRLVAQVPLTEVIFDQLFNGRSGYRAQYYLSPEEGVLYNRDILEAVVSIIRTAYA